MRLLFVCTGNTCRSPLAEGLARRLASERGLADLIVSSAGTSAWDGASASDGSLLVAMEHGIDLSAHRTRQLSRELVAEADVILTMGPHHLERVQALGGSGKASLLHDFATHGESQAAVSDPFGGDLDVYRATYQELDQTLRRVLDRLAHDRQKTDA
jgi:protein-tyrosine-phosphatase